MSRICSAVRADNSRRERRRLRQSVSKLANLSIVAKEAGSLLRVVRVWLAQVFDIVVPSRPEDRLRHQMWRSTFLGAIETLLPVQ